jgi:predicted ArsR family transcriptional regulator
MHSTKTEILALLKRSDGSTVDDLASALGLAPMTVRQHLTALERDELVRAEEVRRPTGRPHYRYSLTADGHRRVSDGYDRMLALLVEHVGGLEAGDLWETAPDERRARLFHRAAEALAQTHRAELRNLTAAERADRIASILRSHGGFAEWHELDGGAFELRDFSCVFRATVGSCVPCEWHETFLAAILGTPVRPADEPADCAECCRYIIPARVLAPAL